MLIELNLKMFFLAPMSNPAIYSLPGILYAVYPRTRALSLTLCDPTLLVISRERVHMHWRLAGLRLQEPQVLTAHVC